MQAMLADRDRDRRQLADLVALRRSRVDPLVLTEVARACLTALRPVLDQLVHLLERKQRPVPAFVTGLAAARSARPRLTRARWRRGRIPPGRKRGVARAPVEPLLKLADTGLEPPVRLDQLTDPHQQADRRLPVTVENRLRLGTLHDTHVP